MTNKRQQVKCIALPFKYHCELLFSYIRALELAVKHKTHVDTVIAHRNKHLSNCEKKEDNKRFLQFAQGVSMVSQTSFTM